MKSPKIKFIHFLFAYYCVASEYIVTLLTTIAPSIANNLRNVVMLSNNGHSCPESLH
jgi:hypothetical protein